jgi:hypothetical protein
MLVMAIQTEKHKAHQKDEVEFAVVVRVNELGLQPHLDQMQTVDAAEARPTTRRIGPALFPATKMIHRACLQIKRPGARL